jgi:DNA-binding GntR family transcriptional regulator
LRYHGLFSRMIRENRYSLLAEQDVEFHVAVIEFAQNRAATEMYRDVLQKLILGNGGWRLEGSSLTSVLNEHEKIIEALTIRDVDLLLKVVDLHPPWVAKIPWAVREKEDFYPFSPHYPTERRFAVSQY